MTNRNRNSVQELQGQFIDKILLFMKENEYNMVEFRNAFRVYINEESYDGDVIQVPIAARYLYADGNLGTEDQDVILKELSIYELAYMLDVLEGYEFTVVDEVEN